jgi:hypothetical protein
MKVDEFEQLVTGAGLNLLSAWVPRFIVSLHVPTQFGTRIQTAVITFASQDAFEAATTEQVVVAIDDMKQRLQKAAKTQQGDIARGCEVLVKTSRDVTSQAAGVQYPAH